MHKVHWWCASARYCGLTGHNRSVDLSRACELQHSKYMSSCVSDDQSRRRENETTASYNNRRFEGRAGSGLHGPLYGPLYLLLSGFARGQALGCHAVARADRMQKSMQKHCRDMENDWSIVLNRRLPVSTFSPNHWSWRCHPPCPSLGWDRSSRLWSWTCARDQGEEAACHRRRCRSRPVGRRDKFAKSLRKKESRSRNTRNVHEEEMERLLAS